MTRLDLLIRNGIVVTAAEMVVMDIGVRNGSIVAMASRLAEGEAADRTIDAAGLHVLPGLVDVHVHCNEPGRTEWEGLHSGSRALAAGGVTTFFDMPLNSNPPTLSGREFIAKRELAARLSIIDYGILGGLTPDNLECLDQLAGCGAIGLKGFMSDSGIPEFAAIEGRALRAGLKRAADLGLVVMLHAESQAMTSELTTEAIASGRLTAEDYERSRPIASELEACERAIEAARATHATVHVVHASSAAVVKRVRRAASEGADVSVETCPHYLSLTVEDTARLGAIAKCSPPLRRREEVDALWGCISRNEVDIVASDHSPSVPEMKATRPGGSIFDCWGGISSAQTMMNVLLDEGYHERGIPLRTIAAIASSNPAKRFALYPTKGALAPGSDADIVLVDLDARTKLTRESLQYRHKMSPYLGRTFRGRVTCTMVRGHIVFERGKIIESGFRGRMVEKTRPSR
jgi:allantoinase